MNSSGNSADPPIRPGDAGGIEAADLNVLRVQYDGLLKSPASWARVGRKLCGALARRPDVELACQPRRGFLWSESFTLPDDLLECPERVRDPDVRVTFGYPPRLGRYPDDAPLWVLSVYEASRLPPSWVEPLRKHPDRILLPSRHAVRVYHHSGLEPETLLRIPYGHGRTGDDDPAGGTIDGPVKVVTVASPHLRKGLDRLPGVLDRLPDEKVRWHVHLPYDPGEPSRFWEDPSIPDRLAEAGIHVTVQSRPDAAIQALLGEADLCVQPSRSEGFGLVILEAMAAGTAVVTTRWGGHLDFAGPGMVTVPGQLRPAGRCQYDERHPAARVLEPDLDALAETLAALLKHPDRLGPLGRRARETVRAWTWDRAAGLLVEALRQNAVNP